MITFVSQLLWWRCLLVLLSLAYLQWLFCSLLHDIQFFPIFYWSVSLLLLIELLKKCQSHAWHCHSILKDEKKKIEEHQTMNIYKEILMACIESKMEMSGFQFSISKKVYNSKQKHADSCINEYFMKSNIWYLYHGSWLFLYSFYVPSICI